MTAVGALSSDDLPSTSVVVVSRGRPQALKRCLLSLAQQDHPALELVVVADAAGLEAVGSLSFHGAIKTAQQDEANISLARNTGIALAAGEVVLFIDDDSVAEPTWAGRLARAFLDPSVESATGFVRGRNGISYQWRAECVDHLGQDHPLDVPDETSLHPAKNGLAIKTVGTNAGFRRSLLERLEGFDTRFRFFLDETDLNMRASALGGVTAIVPMAQVHHGFAQSDNRRADRAPTDLFEIGASCAVFLAKHCPEDERPKGLSLFRNAQRRRALTHMVSGGLTPGDVTKLLSSFDAGVLDGRTRDPRPTGAAFDRRTQFQPCFPALSPKDHRVFSGRFWQRQRLMMAAESAVASGGVASVFLFSLTSLYHRVSFTESGVWLQQGGVFGRSERSDPIWTFTSFRSRLAREVDRVNHFRASRD